MLSERGVKESLNGYDYPEFPMDPAIEAFEVLAGRTVRLGERCAFTYKGLVHPVHQAGRVFAWDVFEYLNGEEEQ